MVKLSIIIPYYNVQAHLERCVQSVCVQDIPLQEYEVILVDDASTDDSADVARQLASRFGNIRLLSLPMNIKQGGARNAGLKIATGEWIWFVDADDYIAPGTLKNIMAHIDPQIDMLHFNYRTIKGQQIFESAKYTFPESPINGKEFLLSMGHNWAYTCVNVWQRIMRKDFLVKNNISFAENVLYEDVDYSLRCFLKADSVKHIDIFPYSYVLYDISSSRGTISDAMIRYWFDLAMRCDEIISDSQLDIHLIGLIKKYINYLFCNSLEQYQHLSNVAQKSVACRVDNKILNCAVKYLSFNKMVQLISIYRMDNFWSCVDGAKMLIISGGGLFAEGCDAKYLIGGVAV